MNVNPFEILKNAKQIQENIGVFHEKLGSIQSIGTSGGGMVEVEINGLLEVQEVRISAELVEEGDREILQDLAAAAFNNALVKIREALNREMGGLAGMGMPEFIP